MRSDTISSKISACQVILYQRVSTDPQAKGEYRSQLQAIKAKYPKFTIAKSTIAKISEVKSGRADPEIRMASGLGRSLRLMKRHPDAILLVSDADRIARRTDVFELIQEQGLGHRVYDASTGKNVNELVQTGVHRDIEHKTEKLHEARQAGLEQYQAAGGQLGFQNIKAYSREGSLKKRRLAAERRDAILGVVRQMAIRGRGRIPSPQEICDELDRQEIRTGQGHFFNTSRLRQWRTQHKDDWRKALGSYRTHWVWRIRTVVTTNQIEFRNRRSRRRRMYMLTGAADFSSNDTYQSSPPNEAFLRPVWRKEQHCAYRCCDPCRGPPRGLTPGVATTSEPPVKKITC